jgi:hypothetical protein
MHGELSTKDHCSQRLGIRIFCFLPCMVGPTRGGMMTPIAHTGNFCSNSYELAIVLAESLRHQLCLPRNF